jgi:hypothetical protein
MALENATRDTLMEFDRFDEIIRTLTVSPSRRGLAGLFAAGLLTTIGWEQADDTAAKRKKKKKKKKCKPPCEECQACSKGKCKAKADGTPCAGGVCEDGRCDTDCTPDCQGKACGANDGCGGTCRSGICPGDTTCVDGLCEFCIPDCQGKDCGTEDGCGGTCQSGFCPEGAVCEGQCICIAFDCCQNSDCAANQVCVTVENQKFCACDVAHSCGLTCCPVGTTCTSTNPVTCTPI